ncbi:MAG: hypothetical protein WCI20_10380 [bacterium]
MNLNRQSFNRATQFLLTSARPLEQALFRLHFEDGSAADVVRELAAFQNPDGGFGRALEMDMRTPDSSAIATTHGLQTAREIGLASDHELVRRTLAYLRATCDRQNNVWPIIPPTANNAPHAGWWTTKNLAESWNHFRANPTAEIAGYLFLFGSPKDEDWRQQVLRGVLDYLAAQPDTMNMHELLLFVRLAEMVELPEASREKLTRAVAATVECDPARWPKYGLRPLSVVKSPQSPYYAALRDAVAVNLDYLIREQTTDGSWAPTWSWADEFPDVWPVARREWQGVLTLDALRTLRAFGRLEI